MALAFFGTTASLVSLSQVPIQQLIYFPFSHPWHGISGYDVFRLPKDTALTQGCVSVLFRYHC
jgi:hypothetical protein